MDSALHDFNRKKRVKSFPIPTDDARVKLYLRLIREPICLFAEGPAERRDRLRAVLLEREEIPAELLSYTNSMQDSTLSNKEQNDGELFLMGSTEFYEVRRNWLCQWSLSQASSRLSRERELKARPVGQVKAEREAAYNSLYEMNLYASQIGGERPLSCCSFLGDSLLTGSWSGEIKKWSVPDSELSFSFENGHKERVCSIDSSPSDSSLFVSGGMDSLIYLWSSNSSIPIGRLDGHAHRVSRVRFHPSGRLLGSASYDTSWRLWDVERQQELMLQEGHSKEVHCLDFQCDGGLAATGGLDCIGRVWDIRTTHAIMTLQGHASSIYAVAFSPNGHELATGSEDNSYKIWDLRMLKCMTTIPAHTNLISNLVYCKDALLTVSYDCSLKIWGAYNYKLIKTLMGHENKVQGLCIDKQERWIATCGFDRTFKLWCK